MTLLKYLNDDIIKDHFIFSLMRVFIDAERLGTSNQFYEKFSIRNKIFTLIQHIMKSHRPVYVQKIVDYANTYKFEATKMVGLLMNDLTFLIDECIERLADIKRFQDLKDDTERYNALDAETKQLENDKFKENDQRVKTELQVIKLLRLVIKLFFELYADHNSVLSRQFYELQTGRKISKSSKLLSRRFHP